MLREGTPARVAAKRMGVPVAFVQGVAAAINDPDYLLSEWRQS